MLLSCVGIVIRQLLGASYSVTSALSANPVELWKIVNDHTGQHAFVDISGLVYVNEINPLFIRAFFGSASHDFAKTFSFKISVQWALSYFFDISICGITYRLPLSHTVHPSCRKIYRRKLYSAIWKFSRIIVLVSAPLEQNRTHLDWDCSFPYLFGFRSADWLASCFAVLSIVLKPWLSLLVTWQTSPMCTHTSSFSICVCLFCLHPHLQLLDDLTEW